jgi:excisionase family DNA binding protein
LSRKKIAYDKDFLIRWRIMKTEEDLLSTAEVGAHLGVTRQRVLELIGEGRLTACKVGRAYVVRAGDLAALELNRVGRPPKIEGKRAKEDGKK